MPAFINITYDLMVGKTLPQLPTSEIVLELLEDVEVTDQLINSLKKLRKKGYTIALDDFIYHEKFLPLIKLAQIIKVDVLEMSFEQVTAQVNLLKPYKVTLLAEKIETYAMFEHCKELGFKLFQGYFLFKPEIIKGVKTKPSQSKLLRVVQALQDPGISADQLGRLILQDALFTFKLLKIVNASANNLVREISSVTEAINILGIPDLKKWALMIVMLSTKNKPEELSRQLLIRGSMCERIALASGVQDVSGYMIAGLMSGINALLDIEVNELLDNVPLSSKIKSAISEGGGEMGKILQNTIHFNWGNWHEISKDTDNDIYDKAYRESLNWVNNAMQSITET